MEPYKNDFIKCSDGCFGDKKKFKQKLIDKQTTLSNIQLKVIEELKAKYATIFADQPAKINTIPLIDILCILNYETNQILQKKIVGKDDVNISGLIKKLDNSFWVKQGIQFYEKSGDICPFCQQKINNNLKEELENYFDENFTKDVAEIKQLYMDYKSEAERVEQSLKNIIIPNDFCKQETKDLYVELISEFHKNYTANLVLLENKEKETSKVITLNQSNEILNKIIAIIKNVNLQITNHNNTIDNINSEQKQLIQEFWRFLIEIEKDDILEYKNKNNKLQKAQDNISVQIEQKNQELSKVTRELADLEKQTTNIDVVCNNINNILINFGFTNFKLQTVGNNSYKLIRLDNSEANHTLSEGEKNFVTFLYFYNLITGSFSDTGLLKEKVVVFDDPVSSLDNNVLFIVSTLIRSVIDKQNENYKHVKQVFFFTHNTYFYKEVTYKNKGHDKQKLKDENFYIIRKNKNFSKIISYPYNPIKTSYELLWKEIKENPHSTNLPNCMRRILENYFKLLGNISLDNLEDRFEGGEKIICHSLISWIHDGSHCGLFSDEFFSITDDDLVQKQLHVFEKIFEYNGQSEHFRMMMGIENTETEGEQNAGN